MPATAVPLTTLLIIPITLRGRLLAGRTSNHGHRVYHKHQLISQTHSDRPETQNLLLMCAPRRARGLRPLAGARVRLPNRVGGEPEEITDGLEGEPSAG